MNYQYITKQETSAADAAFILDKNGVSHLTYLPGQYADSLVKEKRAADYFVGVDKETIKTIYNIYFMDFVMFNYTIDEYLKWDLTFVWLNSSSNQKLYHFFTSLCIDPYFCD